MDENKIWFVIKHRPNGGMNEIQEKIANVVWRHLCNCCDCENYPECPEGTDGCIADTIAENAIKVIRSYAS